MILVQNHKIFDLWIKKHMGIPKINKKEITILKKIHGRTFCYEDFKIGQKNIVFYTIKPHNIDL
jgi:hypothetical protein